MPVGVSAMLSPLREGLHTPQQRPGPLQGPHLPGRPGRQPLPGLRGGGGGTFPAAGGEMRLVWGTLQMCLPLGVTPLPRPCDSILSAPICGSLARPAPPSQGGFLPSYSAPSAKALALRAAPSKDPPGPPGPNQARRPPGLALLSAASPCSPQPVPTGREHRGPVQRR